MSVLRRAFLVSLFVLLSAVLFATLLPPVVHVLGSYYEHRLNPPEIFFYVAWGGIALAMSVTIVAATFLAVGLLLRRFRKS